MEWDRTTFGTAIADSVLITNRCACIFSEYSVQPIYSPVLRLPTANSLLRYTELIDDFATTIAKHFEIFVAVRASFARHYTSPHPQMMDWVVFIMAKKPAEAGKLDYSSRITLILVFRKLFHVCRLHIITLLLTNFPSVRRFLQHTKTDDYLTDFQFYLV